MKKTINKLEYQCYGNNTGDLEINNEIAIS